MYPLCRLVLPDRPLKIFFCIHVTCVMAVKSGSCASRQTDRKLFFCIHVTCGMAESISCAFMWSLVYRCHALIALTAPYAMDDIDHERIDCSLVVVCDKTSVEGGSPAMGSNLSDRQVTVICHKVTIGDICLISSIHGPRLVARHFRIARLSTATQGLKYDVRDLGTFAKATCTDMQISSH